MDAFFDNIAIPSLYSGIAFAFVGSMLHFSPPSEINGVIGYRTKASMKSQERWDFAQKYSATFMGICGVIMVALSLLSYFIPIDAELKNIGGLGLLLTSAVSMIAATEIALRKRFKNND